MKEKCSKEKLTFINLEKLPKKLIKLGEINDINI